MLYLDSSALVKLVLDEPESEELQAVVEGELVTSCSLVLTEIPRALTRDAHDYGSSRYERERLLEVASDVIDGLALIPLTVDLLRTAGAIDDPLLRTLDAIHVAAAIGLDDDAVMVTYDRRQRQAATAAGLEVRSPGA